MGGTCAFLTSEDLPFMTGTGLAIDGSTAMVDVIGMGIFGAVRRAGIS